MVNCFWGACSPPETVTGEGDCGRGSWRSGETTGRRLKGRSDFRTEGSDGSGFPFSDLRRSPHDDGA
ncbi:hypothetical protein F2Q70_00018186 [Brassica cretica]|uniref:Uncharacterized protein n=1 Tax=Brassica cretica TaxID=69181 RepID=A0A8S9I5Q8_BRACR|nr:hypothetical protein F2Q70_00018186 [Brassica cretica]